MVQYCTTLSSTLGIKTESIDKKVTAKESWYITANDFITTTVTTVAYGTESYSYSNEVHTNQYGQKVKEISNDVTTTYTYDTCGNLTLVTKTNADGVVITEQQNSYGANTVTESSGFSSYTYNYNFGFGTLDKVIKNGYNTTTGLYEASNYSEEFGYDTHKQNLTSLTAKESGTQIAKNILGYTNGELSSLSDVAVEYQITADNVNDVFSFKINDFTATTLEEVSKNYDLNTVTHKYFRNQSETPTDVFLSTYDNYGRLLTESYNGENKVTYTYTDSSTSIEMQNVSSVTDWYFGRTTNYTYKSDGSLKQAQYNDLTIQYGNQNEVYYIFNGTYFTNQVISDGNKVQKVVNKRGGNEEPTFTRCYEYDEFGRLKVKKHLNDEFNYTYGYANANSNFPTSEVYNRGGSTAALFIYEYDEFGNVKRIKEFKGFSFQGLLYANTDYEYDSLGHITKEINEPLNVTNEYTYNNGRLESINGLALTYDSRYRLMLYNNKYYTYDNYGNRISDGTRQYTWTRGRLLSSVGGASYFYYYNGKRACKTVDGVTTVHHYDGDKIIADTRSNGKKLYYLYDDTGVCGIYYNGTNYEVVRNIFGDVLYIYNGNTCVARYRYDAFGNCTIAINNDEIATLNPFRYRGYYYDTESNLYYLQTRYYDPEVGQFISPDSPDYLQPETIGGVDLYAYCAYNPIMFSDPTGHILLSSILVGAIVGFVVSAASSAVSQLITTGSVDIVETLIDGAFGALSGALAASGIGAVASAFIEGGLSFANSVITTGIDQNWNFDWSDWVSMGASAIVSGVISYTSANGKWSLDSTEIFDTATRTSKKVGDRIANGYYKKSTQIATKKAIKSASKYANKLMLQAYRTYNAWLSYGLTFIQSLSDNSFSLLMDGLF